MTIFGHTEVVQIEDGQFCALKLAIELSKAVDKFEDDEWFTSANPLSGRLLAQVFKDIKLTRLYKMKALFAGRQPPPRVGGKRPRCMNEASKSGDSSSEDSLSEKNEPHD